MSNVHEQFDRLRDIVTALRDPGTGCPWDREQTLASIQECIVEEATEAKDAIRAEDFDNLKEELGDVLYNILLQTQIAQEDGRFTFQDVLDACINKLTARHPHVFGNAPMPKNAEEALSQWKQIKKQERGE